MLGQVHSRSRNRASRWNQAWEDWAKNPQLCDHDGRADFWGLQALVFRTVVESGECLIRKRIDPRLSSRSPQILSRIYRRQHQRLADGRRRLYPPGGVRAQR